jgi:hypothetical protein
MEVGEENLKTEGSRYVAKSIMLCSTVTYVLCQTNFY